MVGTRSRQTKPAQELGQRLREERERRRLSVAQVAHVLNVPKRQLAAIEEGDFSVFSAEIYARGVCLKYVTYLGVGGDKAERAVWRALSAGRQLVPLKIHTAFSRFERLWNARLVLWVAIGGIGLVIGGYIAWQVQTFWQLPHVQLANDLPTVTTEQVVRVSGKADPRVRVTINEETVTLQSDASFEMGLQLHPGINIVRVEAENAAGRKATIEKHILLSRR